MKTVVITGASGGIGQALARKFSKEKYAVVLGYNSSRDKAVALGQEIRKSGGEAVAIKVDVRSETEVKSFFESAYNAFGNVSCLVCNAGISRFNLLNSVSESEMYEIINVNLCGTIRSCREAIPYFLENHSGSIVNISSMWGISGASCEAVYSASKAGIIGLTKSLAKELGLSGIRVNCVAPGVIDTEMNSIHSSETMSQLAVESPLSRIGQPNEVADAVYFLCSDEASFITGQTLSVDGGFII